ncbi:MAG: glycosyl transferase family 39 [uncultured bacterium]|uniref:Glycosyltransferase RgtA/B/C/D-like domain-containing protein n=3 Tax=Candidatus Daviesiibacteriota TaxID=1752718 RepID=A0A0G0HE34_9BACT|nr:MAG: glycosyl transferase family 39 [uncultured bacterium]KKQ10374.1 MAG: hypothetical protein US19_C0006G0016 [Candidatus Daviesbacteria bacterium GW2011_GWB1_36_5]KKQ15505.1 MAG: hypothetical protein US28_C0015G0006 [Candidatus Daviesbacteria bacterium GW2011_GWA1_36_8]
MMLQNKFNLSKILLILILIIALFLRVYKLDQIPPAISWDEAAVGYNAYTIANWGRDEWGNFLPLVFKSFEDYKHPVHIYITAIFVKILGLNEFSTRLPAAIFGTLNVLLIYLLGKRFFKSELLGIITAFMLAFSPYALQFSRFNHELQFVLFFFMLGLYLFFKGLEKKNFYLTLSFLSFGICLITYHSAKIIVPLIFTLLIILYFKELIKIKFYFYLGLFILLLFVGIIAFNPALLGAARIKQTGFGEKDFKQTQIYQTTKNENLARLEIIYNQYLLHFQPKYLFESGDQNGRHSSQVVGEFYKIDLIFLVIGFLALLYKRSKTSLIILTWALLALIPSAVAKEAPHAARAGFMLGSFNLIAAYGLYYLINFVKVNYIKVGILIFVLGVNLVLFNTYFTYYLTKYSVDKYSDWQYGMKQIVGYVGEHPEYFQVYMTDQRSQPYIFFLYYLKTPLPEFLESVQYNDADSRSYNLVSFFDRYYFGVGDPIEYIPTKYIMQILEPSKYSGLRYKDAFEVLSFIKYPDGNEGYYIVTAKE